METAFDREEQGSPQPGWAPSDGEPNGARLAFESSRRFGFRKREDMVANDPLLFTTLRKARPERKPAGEAGDGTPGETERAAV
ncbi:MAG TPA: hypothetical protein VFS43_03820 [Polyangiaceae bacterium]|nr:hypothetical protein [Polyangiaceae bacterium]